MRILANNLLVSVALTMTLLMPTVVRGESNIIKISQNFETDTDTVSGESGGSVDSKGCGYIAQSPNHVINIDKRVDYMKITVRASGGQPTLLIKGPGTNDNFCILADQVSGFQPEISGVWEPGQYLIYVGDRTGTQHSFTLNISRSKS
jgi:hypothetical protein